MTKAPVRFEPEVPRGLEICECCHAQLKPQINYINHLLLELEAITIQRNTWKEAFRCEIESQKSWLTNFFERFW